MSRLVTSSRRQYAEKTVRRGLAMILEHGFMNTGEGKEMYRQNLLQIAQCVQETANHDVVSAYLTCDSYDKEWERKHGIKQDGIRRMLTEEVNRTACVQKTVYGLDILVEDVKKRMARYGAKPDMMVIPQKMAIYMTMVRPEKTQYYLGGKVTEENIRQGPDAMTQFRGLNVFETRSFDVYEGEPPIDLLLRRRQHGEYYTASDFSIGKPIKHTGQDGWSAQNLSLQIYDEECDNWRRLHLRQLIEHCAIIPAKGKLNLSGTDIVRVAPKTEPTGAPSGLYREFRLEGTHRRNISIAVDKTARRDAATTAFDRLYARDKLANFTLEYIAFLSHPPRSIGISPAEAATFATSDIDVQATLIGAGSWRNHYINHEYHNPPTAERKNSDHDNAKWADVFATGEAFRAKLDTLPTTDAALNATFAENGGRPTNLTDFLRLPTTTFGGDSCYGVLAELKAYLKALQEWAKDLDAKESGGGNPAMWRKMQTSGDQQLFNEVFPDYSKAAGGQSIILGSDPGCKEATTVVSENESFIATNQVLVRNLALFTRMDSTNADERTAIGSYPAPTFDRKAAKGVFQALTESELTLADVAIKRADNSNVVTTTHLDGYIKDDLKLYPSAAVHLTIEATVGIAGTARGATLTPVQRFYNSKLQFGERNGGESAARSIYGSTAGNLDDFVHALESSPGSDYAVDTNPKWMMIFDARTLANAKRQTSYKEHEYQESVSSDDGFNTDMLRQMIRFLIHPAPIALETRLDPYRPAQLISSLKATATEHRVANADSIESLGSGNLKRQVQGFVAAIHTLALIVKSPDVKALLLRLVNGVERYIDVSATGDGMQPGPTFVVPVVNLAAPGAHTEHAGQSIMELLKPAMTDHDKLHNFGNGIKDNSSEDVEFIVLSGEKMGIESNGSDHYIFFHSKSPISPPNAIYSCLYQTTGNVSELDRVSLLVSLGFTPKGAWAYILDTQQDKEWLVGTYIYRHVVSVAEISPSLLGDEFLSRFTCQAEADFNEAFDDTTGAFVDSGRSRATRGRMLVASNDDFKRGVQELRVRGADVPRHASVSVAGSFADSPEHDQFLANSYQGVRLLAESAADERQQIAESLINYIHTIVPVGTQYVPLVDAPPPNYTHSVNGIMPIVDKPAEAYRASVFTKLIGGHGHTVAAVDKRGNYKAPLLRGDMCICHPEMIAAVMGGKVPGCVLCNCSTLVGVGNPDLSQSVDSRDKRFHLEFATGLQHDDVSAMHTQLAQNNRNVRPNAVSTQPRQSKRVRREASATVETNPLISMFIDGSVNVGAAYKEPQTYLEHVDKEDTSGVNFGAYEAQEFMPAFSNSPNAVENYKRLGNKLKHHRDSTEMLYIQALLGSYLVTKESMKERVEDSYPLPFEFLIFRPFIEHQTYSLIMTKGGSETGATYFGHNNVTLGDDAVSKLHYANLTFYQKSIIHNNKNVYIAEDVYLTGYSGGNSMAIFDDCHDVQYGTENRTGSRYEKSIFVMLMEEGETQQLRNPVDITGHFPSHIDKFHADRQKFRHGQHYSTAAWFRAYFKFDEYVARDGNSATSNSLDPFMSDVQRQNTVCFQGAQWGYHPEQKDWCIETKNTGHLGPTYAGVRPVREGQAKIGHSAPAAVYSPFFRARRTFAT